MSLPLLCATFVACSDYGLEKPTEQVEVLPIVAVDPPQLEFENGAFGGESTLEVTLTNVGSGTLNVTDISLEGAAFAIGGESSAALVPEAQVALEIAHTPSTENDVGELTFYTNDGAQPMVSVPVSGGMSVPRIEMTPLVDIDSFESCPAISGTITIENPGAVEATVTALVLADEDLAWSMGDTALPWTLAPGATRDVEVWYQPGDDWGRSIGQLEAVLAFPGESSQSTLDGWTDQQDWFIETFEQGRGEYEFDSVDFMFFVDQSCSMKDDTTRLGDEFEDFVALLEDWDADWQVAVVAGDDGCYDGQLIDASAADPTKAIQSNLSRGRKGSYTEAGLHVMDQAVSRTGASECNADIVTPNLNRSQIQR